MPAGMSWTCPKTRLTFELGICEGGRRVFKQPREDVSEDDEPALLTGLGVEADDDEPAPITAQELTPGEAAPLPPVSFAEIRIDCGSGARVIALHNDGGAQLLLVAGQLTPPVTNGCEGVEFLESRKKMTKEKAKKRTAEAKQHLQTKRKKATQAEHVGTIVSLLSHRS